MDVITTVAINTLLSSSSESGSSDEENDFVSDLLVKEIRIYKPRIKNYISEVVNKYSEEDFRSHFRLKRCTVNMIHNLLEDKLNNTSKTGRPKNDSKEQLLSALWYLASPDSYRSVCDRFNIGKATALRNVRRVSEALFHLAPQFIRWPNDEEKLEMSVNLYRKYKFPNVIGAIDGSYIKIPLPKIDGKSYICRKNFAALTLQGVCNHRLMFTHCYAGEVASVHDARVLKNSEIWQFIAERSDAMFQHYSLLGDKAYPCLKELLVPFKESNHLDDAKKQYNFHHASCRSIIERAFGLLKNRFRILKFLDIRRLDWAPKIIIACCVLHNICIMQNDLLENFEVDDDADNDVEYDNNIVQNVDEMKREGILHREAVCRNYFN